VEAPKGGVAKGASTGSARFEQAERFGPVRLQAFNPYEVKRAQGALAFGVAGLGRPPEPSFGHQDAIGVGIGLVSK
jgi:hypothetical protein